MRNGTIYIRRPGKSEQANAEDLEMLIERARERPRELALALEAEGVPLWAINHAVLTEEHREAAITQIQQRLLRGVPQSRGPFEFASAAEPRSPERYRSQVDSYLEAVRRRWSTVVAADVVENERVPLALVIVNPTDEVFDSVQVEARLPIDTSWVYSSSGDFCRRLKPPDEPAPWGNFMASIKLDPGGFSDGVEIEREENRVLLRFSPVLVRPGSRHRLSAVLLALPPALAGSEIPLSWRATSASTPGDDSGILRLPVAPDSSVPAQTVQTDAS
jgi:hypothetical protein